jgi:hypothetical protein
MIAWGGSALAQCWVHPIGRTIMEMNDVAMRAKIEAVLQAYREETATEEQLIRELLMILAVGSVARRRMVAEMVQTANRFAPPAADLADTDEDDLSRRGFEDIARFDFNGGFKQ